MSITERSHWLPLVWLLTLGCMELSLRPTETALIAAEKAVINRSVAGAADYLRQNIGRTKQGRRTLAAYALHKAGESVTSSAIVSAVNEVLTRFENGQYNVGQTQDEMYEAAVVAMLLEDIDAKKYRPELEAIADYFIDNRMPEGVWSYRSTDIPGDTSVTQYGCLGLWAATRAGVEVPDEVWDRVMLWHFQTQLGDGGFAYTPGTDLGLGKGRSTLSMTSAAVGTMSIAALHLFPDQMQESLGVYGAALSTKEDPFARKFGVLERGGRSGLEDNPIDGQRPYRVQSTFAEYQRHTHRAIGWLTKNFEPSTNSGPEMYYYYSLERMGALSGIQELGSHDWYDECADFLIDRQMADGSWDLDYTDKDGPYPIGSSFGILFLTRATAKLLNRLPNFAVGGGLLAGGRGLPDDLKQVELNQGDVKAREASGPLDELLRDLSRAGGDDLFELQEKIVEKIQLGDRSELIGQTAKLVKLVEHPQPQVRRTAMWALGRSDDLKLVRHAIAAIIDDPDTDVLVEAHAALCWFSRRPDGFGLAENPVAYLPPDVSDEDRKQAVDQWRKQAIKAWGEWYLRVAPYEERDDPFYVRLKRRLEGRR